MRPSNDVIKKRYAEYLRSRYPLHKLAGVFLPTRWYLGWIAAVIVALFLIIKIDPHGTGKGLAYWFFFGLPSAIFAIILIKRNLQRGLTERKQHLLAAQQTEPVIAFPLMANTGLLNGVNNPLPALVLFSFDDEFENTSGEMIDLVVKLTELSDLNTQAPDVVFAKSLFDDEKFHPGRRRRVPASLTGGKVVYAGDLMVYPRNSPKPLSEMPMLLCMATRGDSGQIQHVPITLLNNPFVGAFAKDDPRLKEIQRLAQADMPVFLESFHSKPENRHSVKIPITDVNGTEHLWMTLKRVEGDTLFGIVGNDPRVIKSVKINDEFSITKDKVEDLMIWSDQENKVLLGGYHLRKTGVS